MALADTPMPTDFVFNSFEMGGVSVASETDLGSEQLAKFLLIRALYETKYRRFVLAKLQVADTQIGLPAGALCVLSGRFKKNGAFQICNLHSPRQVGPPANEAESEGVGEVAGERSRKRQRLDVGDDSAFVSAVKLDKAQGDVGVVLRPQLFLRGQLVVDETHPQLKFAVEPVAVCIADLFRGAALQLLQRIQPAVTMGNPMRLLKVDAKSRLLLCQVSRSGFVAQAQGFAPEEVGEENQDPDVVNQVPTLARVIDRDPVPEFRLSTFGLRCAAELLNDDVVSVLVEVFTLVDSELGLDDTTLPFTREIRWFKPAAPPPAETDGGTSADPGDDTPGPQQAYNAFLVGLEAKDGLAFARSTSAYEPTFETYRLGNLSSAHERLHAFSHVNFNVMQPGSTKNIPFPYKPPLLHDAAPTLVKESVLGNLVEIFLSLYEMRRIDRETVVLNRNDVRRRLVFRRREAVASLHRLPKVDVKDALKVLGTSELHALAP